MNGDVFSVKKISQTLTLEPASTAVLVIDMVNDFCKEPGTMVLPGYEQLLPAQQKIIAVAREVGSPIIFIVDAHRRQTPGDREFLKRYPHCYEHEWGSEIISELVPLPQDIIVTKRRFSAFFNTDLDLTLRDLQIKSLLLMGVALNICVRSTIHDGFFQGYQNIIVKDGVAATSPREEASTLYDIATHFGSVAYADDIINNLKNSAQLKLWEAEL